MDTGRGRLVAGRYRLSVIIGRGGMGVVWRARDEFLDRAVAVKEVFWPPYFTEPEQQAACRRATTEAQMAARLNHRNVIRVFDIVEEDGYPWIIMELLPYRSLRDFVEQEGPLAPAQAARVGLGILAALRAAHAEGIVHRDVKPANVLVGPDRVVLTDFGIACAADNPALGTAGVLIGSPSYIAPERATGRQSGAPADLWGLGASLYAAVEGRPPFDRDGEMASLRAVVTDEPDPAVHAGPLWPVISGLLRKDPVERLDAAATERMLRNVIDAPVLAAAHASPASSGSFSSGSRRSRGPLVALAGSAALAVLVASGTAVGLVLTNSPGQQAAPAAAIARPPPASAPPLAIARPPAPSTRPPVAAARPPAASTGFDEPSGSHLTARTAHAKRPRPRASRPGSATARSGRQGNTGGGASRVSLISRVQSSIRGARGWSQQRAQRPGQGSRDDSAGVQRSCDGRTTRRAFSRFAGDSSGGTDESGECLPAHDAGFGLGEQSAGTLLDAVVPAGGCQVALDGGAAGVSDGAVEVGVASMGLGGTAGGGIAGGGTAGGGSVGGPGPD